jgi:hypothetical protein
MKEEDKAKIYIKLYEIQVSLFFSRVSVEWKVFISALTALVLATGYLAPKIDVDFTLIAIFILAGFIYVAVWLYGLWRANEIDKRWSSVYRSHAEKIAGQRKEVLKFKKPRVKEFFKDWSMIGQIIIIAVLIFLSLWIIHIVEIDSGGKGTWF